MTSPDPAAPAATPATTAGRGRPRDADVDARVLRATRSLVVEVGYEATTVERIAACAGVGKASIYRRWPHRAAVVTAAFAAELGDPAPIDTGSLRGDLLAHLRESVHVLTLLGGPSVLAAAIAERGEEGQRDLADIVRARTRRGAALVRRGVERGELDPAVHADLVVDGWAGYLLLRVLLDREVPGEADLTALVDALLRAA